MTYKYIKLNPESTIDSLKKEYKKWAFRLHPDMGGNTAEMQILNNEYEAALTELGKINNKNYTSDSEFMDIIEKLIKLKMQNVEIEICGWFIYITGNTKKYKDQLKALKLLWNNQKLAWYYKPSWYVRKHRRTWNMEEIRSAYGSKTVTQEVEEKLQLAGN